MLTSDLINNLIDALAPLYNQWGYLIVFLGVLGENTALVGLVLPGGTLALLGAFYARQGTLALPLVVLFAWLGTVIGYSTDYLLGRYALARLLPWATSSRLGRHLRLAGRLRQARRLLAHHGGKAIMISHAFGHIRSFVALTAGMTHMRYPRFLAFELVAALLWNTGYCLLGYLAGAERERLQMFIERGGWIALIVLALVYLFWRYALPRLRPRRAGRRKGAKGAKTRAGRIAATERPMPMTPRTELPEGYRLRAALDLSKNRAAQVLLTLAGLLCFVAFGIAFSAAAVALRHDIASSSITVGLGGLLVGFVVLVAVALLVMLLHEAVHGLIFWLLTGARPIFGLGWTYAYTAAPDWYLPRGRFALVGLAPLVLLTALGLALLPIVPLALVPLLVLALTLNAAGAVGDLALVGLLLAQPHGVLARDTGHRVEFYAPQQG